MIIAICFLDGIVLEGISGHYRLVSRNVVWVDETRLCARQWRHRHRLFERFADPGRV